MLLLSGPMITCVSIERISNFSFLPFDFYCVRLLIAFGFSFDGCWVSCELIKFSYICKC